MASNGDDDWNKASIPLKIFFIGIAVLVVGSNVIGLCCCGPLGKMIAWISTVIRGIAACLTTTIPSTSTTGVTAATTRATTTAPTPNARIKPEVLATLPTFLYSTTDHKKKLECAVCLMEFQDGDKGRFLPRCLHSFHAECVDMWFDSHSTCPLCRSTVEAQVLNSPV